MKKLDPTIQFAVDIYAWMLTATEGETMMFTASTGVNKYFTCKHELPEEEKEGEDERE